MIPRMENKKQLVIVPPMSEPLQKLNEVLQTIANDENIEISIIDDAKELMQFVGSSGQCLVAFSNAKKCATFLQDNKNSIAKSHSKVILLTPKEIPAKTLVKFVKIGLTESILESSPPKTLLYKVKLLLRSIKSTVSNQEEKDQVIKSTLDMTQAAAKSDLSIEKTQTEEVSVNYLEEGRAKFKTDQSENEIDYGENLKGKTSAQEEAIETHWKSKKNKETNLVLEEPDRKNSEGSVPDDIDMYMRGKSKKNSDLLNNEEDQNLKNTKIKFLEQEEAELKPKRKSLTELELEPGEKNRNNFEEEDAGDLVLKPSKKGLELIAEDNAPVFKENLTEEEKAKNHQKDLDELDALIAEAKKRQAQEAEDIGGFLKGKILNNESVEEESEDYTEKKEYDNSELNQKEKSIDLDLIEAELEKKKRAELEELDETDAHEGQVDKIDNNMLGENGSTDKISTLMMSEIGENKNKNISTKEIYNLDPKNKLELINEEEDYKEKKKLEISEKLKDINKKDKDNENDEDNDLRDRPDKLKQDKEAEDYLKKEKSEDENTSENDRKKSIQLKLEAAEKERQKIDLEESDPNMAYRKSNQSQLDLEKGNANKTHDGKVDKIDSFYRGGESKKTEHDWDNLDQGRNNTQLQLQKSKRANDDTQNGPDKKDYGEETIDYRKLKEEFNSLSRGESSGEEENYDSGINGKSRNEEDDGTFKVIEMNPRGFDFGINIINLIYQKESKHQDFYKMISEEIIEKYKAYTVFYTFKASDQKHYEVFDSFMHFSNSIVKNELKEWWIDRKTQSDILSAYFSKTMTTWLCREIKDKSGNQAEFWEDVELPKWADNELINKKVELIFPFYDGLERMGVALLLFPEGVRAKDELGLTVSLEMARTAMLDTLIRKLSEVEPEKSVEETLPEKNKIKSLFSGLFNRKKAG